VERESLIMPGEADALLQLRDPTSHTIKKRRISFFYMDQFFELDLFHDRLAGLALLEREYTKRNSSDALPPFIKVKRDVTGDKRYSNRALARLDSLPPELVA
jgi:CYTH domain-containing protein